MTDYFIQIGDYKEGKLTGSAKEAFETELASNGELKRAVENHSIADAALDMLWEDDARQVAMRAYETISALDVDIESQQKKGAKVVPLRRMVAVAAGVLALGACTFLLFQNLEPSRDKIYALHALDTFVSDDSTMGTSTEHNSLTIVDRAHVLMDNQKFKEASDLLESQSLDEDETPKAQYLMALSYYMQDRIVERDSMLKIIHDSPNHIYKNRAQRFAADLK